MRTVLFAVLLGCLIPASAAMIDLNQTIELRCGPQWHIIWADETGEIPPCLIAYSQYCDEIQSLNPGMCAARPDVRLERVSY
ncbi:hypothetical protein ACTSKR_07875 [Chitinibacteraceae bacterium HSL-7]